MGQIGATLGNLVGIGQNAGVNTFGAADYGQNYGALTNQMNTNYQAANAAQTGLAGQYGQIAAGQGPNPAQAMLNQTTGANVANQASLAAGQRGAASNVGMVQRNAAQQGRQAQQQAAGQGASMQAQQQLGALGAQAGIYGSQSANAIGGIGAYESAINAANQVNAGSAAQRAQFGQGFGGGLLQGVGSMIAEGGYVEDAPKVKMADGGGVDMESNYTSPIPSSQGSGSSFVSQYLNMGGGQGGAGGGHQNKGLAKNLISSIFSKSTSVNPTTGASSLGSNSTYNQTLTPSGNVMANSPGAAAGNAGWSGADMGAGAAGGAEGAAAADATAGEAGGEGLGALLAATGGQVSKLKAQGGHVPGQAKVKGNSYSNDTVKALLSPGEVVIPRSVMTSQDPVRGAAQFVQAVMAKKRKKA